MTSQSRALRQPLMIALVCAALLVYIVLLGRTAILMIGSGRAVAIALGGALLVLPVIGLWAMVATVRAELDADPRDWRRWYRLARAYDYAGDRSRSREAMKKALRLQGRE